MEKIQLKDIDCKSLKPLENQGNTSSIYIYDGECYKFLDKLDVSLKPGLYEKISDIEGMEVDGIILPKKIIEDNGNFVGYVTDYFSQSATLYDYFTKKRYEDANDILVATKKASIILKNAHKSGIVLQDVSFDNFLIDENGNVRLCDIDSCKFKEKYGHYISGPLKDYYLHMHRLPEINENLDRQSLFFSMLLTMYHKRVLSLSTYDELSQEIKTLKELRNIMFSLLITTNTWVPYLDEVIIDNDHYTIDRNTQVSKEKALKNDYSL